jgi:hypothetical protein
MRRGVKGIWSARWQVRVAPPARSTQDRTARAAGAPKRPTQTHDNAGVKGRQTRGLLSRAVVTLSSSALEWRY